MTLTMRLPAFFAIVALLAPAVAVCAGADVPSFTARHECCPASVSAGSIDMPASSMAESCCRMSGEAGQRTATPTAPRQALSSADVSLVPTWCGAVANILTSRYFHTAPQLSDHVARHLLLSVLIV